MNDMLCPNCKAVMLEGGGGAVCSAACRARSTKRIQVIDRQGYMSLLADAYDDRFPTKRALACAIIDAFRRGEEVVFDGVHFVLAEGI